ncbi:YicC family protein [Adhaeribacter swui]|uniref:YicC family protein n=1 Tax=Adhaeribacter swui TaxID=2086471 RepID=A0A7G7G3H8_9BACT|nr:YicC/YloC family endoribonuclease [Adhaeribacter swui]QNF31712.1 YicC family protein [Adhaeribacter swui]
MLKSMTGYGLAQKETEQYAISVEIKSLNSKSMDLSVRIPRFLADKEHEIRNTLSKNLIRGKINLTIDFTRSRLAKTRNFINTELLQLYYTELELAADRVGANKNELFRLALQMPEVVQQGSGTEEENEAISWDEVQEVLTEALQNFNNFRVDEGKALTAEIMTYIDRIRILLAEIDKQDPIRIEHIRNRLRSHLAEINTSELFNENRFEQEMIYFIEKLDIAEEKVRLINHLHYFTETVYLPEPTGKKLGFISQEIGREINTIGSKANDATIQRFVVEMKEELEKIKEQLNNIL